MKVYIKGTKEMPFTIWQEPIQSQCDWKAVGIEKGKEKNLKERSIKWNSRKSKKDIKNIWK